MAKPTEKELAAEKASKEAEAKKAAGAKDAEKEGSEEKVPATKTPTFAEVNAASRKIYNKTKKEKERKDFELLKKKFEDK